MLDVLAAPAVFRPPLLMWTAIGHLPFAGSVKGCGHRIIQRRTVKSPVFPIAAHRLAQTIVRGFNSAATKARLLWRDSCSRCGPNPAAFGRRVTKMSVTARVARHAVRCLREKTRGLAGQHGWVETPGADLQVAAGRAAARMQRGRGRASVTAACRSRAGGGSGLALRLPESPA